MKNEASVTTSPAASEEFGYATWDLTNLDLERAEIDALSGGEFWKFKSGRNVVRFLPPKSAGQKPFVAVQQHYVAVPGREKKVTFACPRTHAKRFCPACARAEQLLDTGRPADAEAAKELKPSLNVYAQIVDRVSPEPIIQVVRYGKQVSDQLLDIAKECGNYTDPTKAGFDIVVTKTGQGMQTEYTVLAARENSPLGDDLAILGGLRSLSRFVNVPDEQALIESLGPEYFPRGRRADALPAPAVRRGVADDLDDAR